MIVEVSRFEIIGNILFTEGIGIIRGISAAEYRDVNYSLIFESKIDNKCYEKPLAKTHRPELTIRYAQNSENYDKCYFTTRNWSGIIISDIPTGNYCIKLKIQVRDVIKTIILTQHEIKCCENLQFRLNVDEYSNLLEIKEYSEIKVSPFNNRKFEIVGSYIDDCNNTIVAPKGLLNCNVSFKGRNNRIFIHHNVKIKNVNIECMMNNAIVYIDESVRMQGNWRIGNGCVLQIGKNSSSTNAVYITCAESSKVIIGEDCMFATNNQIRTDDAHPIYDVKTGKRINLCEDIILGDHIWVAFGATILGGSHIGSGSIVGAYSLVNKSHSNNCLIVGTPAKTVKQDIFWERTPVLVSSEKPINFTLEEMEKKSYCKETV